MSIISAALNALRTNRRTALLLAAATFAMIPLGGAHAAYPDRPITIIACFHPAVAPISPCE